EMVGESDVAALAWMDAVAEQRHVQSGNVARQRIETEILQMRGANRHDRTRVVFRGSRCGDCGNGAEDTPERPRIGAGQAADDLLQGSQIYRAVRPGLGVLMSLAPDERRKLSARRRQNGPQRGVVRLPWLPRSDRRAVDRVTHECRIYPSSSDDPTQELGNKTRSISAAIRRDRPGRQCGVAVPGGEGRAVGARNHAKAG